MSLRISVAKMLIRPLDLQIEEFLEWKKKRTVVSMDAEILEMFSDFIKKKRLQDVTPEDIDDFKKHIYVKVQTDYFYRATLKSLRCLFRYHLARKLPCIVPLKILENGDTVWGMNPMPVKKVGRPRDFESIKLVKQLRQNGEDGKPMTFKDISTKLRRNVSLIHRWAKFDLPKV